jgi:hypothetical protein
LQDIISSGTGPDCNQYNLIEFCRIQFVDGKYEVLGKVKRQHRKMLPDSRTRNRSGFFADIQVIVDAKDLFGENLSG